MCVSGLRLADLAVVAVKLANKAERSASSIACFSF
jgi:hypothetical protein